MQNDVRWRSAERLCSRRTCGFRRRAGTARYCRQRHRWQSPLTLRVLRPDNIGINQRHLLDHEVFREERRELHAQPEGFRFQEISRIAGIALGNSDAAQLQSGPRRHTDTAQLQSGAEPLAEFLLNFYLCALRLHIQIDTNEQNTRDDHGYPDAKDEKSPEIFHAGTLRSAALKKRLKPPSP